MAPTTQLQLVEVAVANGPGQPPMHLRPPIARQEAARLVARCCWEATVAGGGGIEQGVAACSLQDLIGRQHALMH